MIAATAIILAEKDRLDWSICKTGKMHQVLFLLQMDLVKDLCFWGMGWMEP